MLPLDSAKLQSKSCKFSIFKVQGLDIETLKGAEGPLLGPKGPQPSAGARRKGA